MGEQPFIQQHIQALYRYMHALESGDIDTISTLLENAEHDQTLERMLLEVNSMYQNEDHIVVSPEDVVAAQQLLLQLADLTTQTTIQTTLRREEMNIPISQQEENILQLQVAVSANQTEPESTNDYIPAKKRQNRAMPVFPARTVATRKWYRAPKSWLTAAVAALLVVFLLLPGTSALASQFLSFFRVQQFQPVQVTKQDISNTLSQYAAPSIDDLGIVQFQPGSLSERNNLTLSQAAQSVAFPLLLPRQLPQGVSNDPNFSVISSGHGVFTFSSVKIHAYLLKNGHPNVQVPANLDGATFDVTTSAGVLAKYGYRTGNPFLFVEIPGPVVRATGKASLQELRDFVLSLPNLPPQLVTQLKQIDLNSGTIPLPIPSGIQTQSVTVHHISGLLLSSTKLTTVEHMAQFPAGNMVIWQEKGIVYAFGGITIDAKQLLTSANSLP